MVGPPHIHLFRGFTIPTPPTVYVPPSTQVPATYVDPGTPYPTDVPVASPVVGTATPFPPYAAPPPAAVVNTYQTPQTVTGTIVLTNTYVAPMPPLTPTLMAGLLWVVLSYTLLWPWIEDNLRYVLAAVGMFSIALAWLSGSPQYLLGWGVVPFGLLFWRLLTRVVRPRAPGDL